VVSLSTPFFVEVESYNSVQQKNTKKTNHGENKQKQTKRIKG